MTKLTEEILVNVSAVETRDPARTVVTGVTELGLVQATQEVVDRLLDEEAVAVADLGEFIGKTVQFRVEPVYSREQFDIIRL